MSPLEAGRGNGYNRSHLSNALKEETCYNVENTCSGWAAFERKEQPKNHKPPALSVS